MWWLFAIAGAALLTRNSRRGRRRMTADSVFAKDGVDLSTLSARAFAVAELVGQAVNGIVITSTIRSPQQQAAAMLAKVDRGENLAALYGDDAQIRELLAADRDQWAGIIQRYASQGFPLSYHLTGDAFDVRIRDRSAAEIDAMIAAVEQAGWDPVLESDHLHVEPR